MHFQVKSLLELTSKGSVSTCLQIHFTVAPLAHLSGIVADVVAAIFAAAEADALLEAIRAGALEGETHVVFVHQGVHKQVHSTLMLALHHRHEIWRKRRRQVGYTVYGETVQKTRYFTLVTG